MSGVVERVHLSEKTLVEQDDLVIEIDPERVISSRDVSNPNP